jgi:hypothetical protein
MATDNNNCRLSGFDIPIFHIALDGKRLLAPDTTPSKDFCKADPCIEIGFFYDVHVFAGERVKYNFTKCIALIDTGADNVYVDSSLIDKYKCPIAPGGDSMTVNAEPGHTAHHGSLTLLQDLSIVNLWVQRRDFVRERRRFLVVLGRRFLQFCSLNWDGPKQIVSLRYTQRDGGVW